MGAVFCWGGGSDFFETADLDWGWLAGNRICKLDRMESVTATCYQKKLLVREMGVVRTDPGGAANNGEELTILIWNFC